MSKDKKSHYGYKLHNIMDSDYDLIRRIETTTANVHDSQVDLSEKSEVVFQDREYHGARGHPIEIREKMRYLRISRKRSKGERPCVVIKTIFHAG